MEELRTNTDLLKEFENFLKLENIDTYNYAKEKKVIEINLSDDNGRYKFIALAQDEINLFHFYSFYPIKVKKEKLNSVLEILNYINNEIDLGKFSLDIEGRNIRFSYNIVIDPIIQSNYEIFKHLLTYSLYTINYYSPIILTSIYNDETLSKYLFQEESKYFNLKYNYSLN